MKPEIKGLYFDAQKDQGASITNSEMTPRDLQREALRREHGEEGVKALEDHYKILDQQIEKLRQEKGIS